MKKFFGLLLVICFVCGMVFSSGCGGGDGIGAIIGGALFVTLLVTATGGAGAPVAFAASVREDIKPKIFEGARARQFKLRFRVKRFKNGTEDLTASPTIFEGDVVNSGKGFQGSVKVEQNSQFQIEFIASDSNTTVMQNIVTPPSVGNEGTVPMEVNPDTTAKAIVYQQWVAKGPTNPSMGNFESNVVAAGLDAEIRGIGAKIQNQFLNNTENLATYTPVTDPVVQAAVASVTPKVTTENLESTQDTTVPGVKWSQLTANAAFSARDCFTPIVFNGKIWLYGGWEGYTWAASESERMKNDLWSTTDGINWTREIASAPMGPRHFYGAAVFGGKMWIIGGRPINGTYADAWSSSDGVNWTKECENIGANGYMNAAVLGDKLYVVSSSSVLSSSDGKTWTVETTSPQYGYKVQPGVTAFNNKLWVYSGEKSTVPSSSLRNGADEPGIRAGINIAVAQATPSANLTNDIWSSPDGKTWTQEAADGGFPGRISPLMLAEGDRIWMMGGYYHPASGSGVLFRPDLLSSTDGKTWTQVTPNTGFTPRSSGGFVRFNGALTAFGGFVGGVNDTIGTQTLWLQFMANDVWISK